jgi:hypothetical protein
LRQLQAPWPGGEGQRQIEEYQTLLLRPIRHCTAQHLENVRGGSYGDPAAVPFHVWRTLQAGLAAGTAYTHQWKAFPELASFAMASVDTPQEREEAKALGFRTFRVRSPADPILPRESVCPASAEAGKKTACDLCRACGGHSAKAKVDMVIMAHGGTGKERIFTNNQHAA